ncbi:slit homolog 3 protein-like [Lingula anatina]|uniref:Slit homolog 3 protein-like n=1 Tax=Lingula anatina TaxID=7574 RepID=A0A1S3ILY2_LINAN|nr:slit homolog 3 protein-like [Lingula anatina]|eukprot:XP_013399083.1 slit homolog 3 protein-like [Lingula anatina]
MSNLEILDISSSELPLSALDNIETFQGLRVFNFSFNKLRDVTPAIQRSRLLRRLYLRSNDIWYVPSETFKNISNLTVLDLGGNKISALPPFAFSGVEESLERLYLDGNQLNTLDKCTILRLTRLHRLRIGGNPFHCDCKVAWLRLYRDKGRDIDLDRTFCKSPIGFKGMEVSGFLTEGCAPSHLTLNMKDCFKFISPTNNVVTETSSKHTDSTTGVDEPEELTASYVVTQATGDIAQPLTSLHFSRQALASAYLAIGFSATCLAIIVVYVIVTGCRFYRRCRGKQTTANSKSERTMSGLQETNFTETGETGPYQELESMNLKFLSLLLYLTAQIAVSTVQARCPFIPDCEACYVSTYGDSREQDLWTLMCRYSYVYCDILCTRLRSMNKTFEVLDLSHGFGDFYSCPRTCDFNSSNTPSVYEIDLSYSRLRDDFGGGPTYFLKSLKYTLRILKLQYARLYLFRDTLRFSNYPKLRDLDLSGTFPALRYGYISLDGATSLETLYLDNNRLSEVPYEIRNMTSLKHLSLQHNFLNKTALDKHDIFPLALMSLDLSHNKFRGSADFSWMNLLNLRTLRMQNTSIGYYSNYLPKRLENMSNLEILDISSSELPQNALDHIEMFQELRVFNFSFNKLRDVTPAIKKSSLLRWLYLRSNDIWYVAPETFKNISNLTVLDLGGNKISSLSPIAFTGVEESLERLYLDGNQLKTLDKCTILRLTRLRRLRIGGNPFHCDCKIAWLRSWLDKVEDNDVDKAFCNSPKEFKGMDVSVFSTESCAPSQLTFEDCFEPISPTSNAQVTDDEPMTSFTRQALVAAHLAVGFSATCLVFIVVYITVTGYRFYKRFRGIQTTTNTYSERTMSGVQNTNFTEVGETGPYQGLETAAPYQNVADGNQPTGSSYEALNPHTAI